LLDGHSGTNFNLRTGSGYSVRGRNQMQTGREAPYLLKPRRLAIQSS